MTGTLLQSVWSEVVGRDHWQRFAADRKGATAMLVALGAPVIFGFTAFAVDVGLWRAEQMRLQAAVDVATLAAAHAQMNGADETTTRDVVARELARNGFDPAGDGVGFTMALVDRQPPTPYKDVEVAASTDGAYYFAKLFLSEPPLLEASALGGIDPGNLGRICVLGLEVDQPGSVQFDGNPEVDLNCSVASNSEDVVASMQIASNSVITAAALIAAGGITNVDSANITADAIWPEAPPVVDPFGPFGRNLQPPLAGTCDVNGQTNVKRDMVLTPGRYCGGIRVNGATATFAPGLYVIYNGDLDTIGQASLVGEGVTFVLTGSTANQIGSMNFSGGTHLDLAAPAAGTPWAEALGYEGILFYQDQNATAKLSNGGDNLLLGGTVARLDGTAYFPRQTLMYTGGAELEDGCLMLVARQVYFRGNAEFMQTDEACDALGVEPLRLPSVKLLG
jgi:Flp pilus assembly protein TadG